MLIEQQILTVKYTYKITSGKINFEQNYPTKLTFYKKLKQLLMKIATYILGQHSERLICDSVTFFAARLFDCRKKCMPDASVSTS